jgi:hypothetical protein
MASQSPAERSPASDGVVPGASIGRNRHTARAENPGLVPRRCLTCKNELPAGVERYCDEACLRKEGCSKRSPGRTAARRRRRRGGRKR